MTRISFDSSACVGCKVCVAACCDCHDLPIGQQVRWVDIHEEGCWVREDGIPVMKGVRCWADSHACQHCDEPACMEACRLGAISKTADGIVLIDLDVCKGCGKCGRACQHGAIITVARMQGEAAGLGAGVGFAAPHSGEASGDYAGREHADGAVGKAGGAVSKRVSLKCDMCLGVPEGPQCVAACPMRCLTVSD